MTQAEASGRAGVSQAFWSALERGGEVAASLETLAARVAAAETQLAASVEARPGADLPRDIAHLRGQAAIIGFASAGGWCARVEDPIDPASRRSRSIDLHLERMEHEEIAVVELVDLLADGGEAMGGLGDNVAVIRRMHPRATVAGLPVRRARRQNHEIARDLRDLFDARFPGVIRAMDCRAS